MRLDLHDIINKPGGSLSFSYGADFSDLEFEGVREIKCPVSVSGEVKNAAGVLRIRARSTAKLSCVCARCAAEFDKTIVLDTQAVLADEIYDEDNTDIYLLDGDAADLDEIVRTDFILNMDTRLLCREDCKGLCPGCGVNLNVDACRCKPQGDPRLAVLAQFFEDSEE